MTNNVLPTPPHHVFHLFDPCMTHHHHRHPDEVDFSKGRYIDIASTQGKDPNTLYFGVSLTSNLLTGIFLGDVELTSKIKDVLLESDETGAVTMTVKFINEKNKLATVKTTLATQKQIEELTNIVDQIKDFILEEDARIKMLETSTNMLEDFTAALDASLNWLKDELDDGIYNYTIKKDEGSYKDGYKRTFTLFKGENELVDSEKIELTDMGLRRLTYIDDDTVQNTVIATIFPSALKDDSINEFDPVNKVVKFIDTKIDDNGTVTTTPYTLDTSFVYNVSLNLDGYDEHINIKQNTDSSVNDRLTFVEELLTWEKLFNN